MSTSVRYMCAHTQCLLTENMSSAKRKSFVLMVIGVCSVLLCNCADGDNVTRTVHCETNKDCDKNMECFENQCTDPCRKSPCGTNAICKVNI